MMTRGISIWSFGTASGRIRGKQVCNFLGAKKNPDAGFEDDVCIFVKMTPAISKWGKLFIDPVDAPRFINFLKLKPEYSGIAISKVAYEYMTSIMKNEIVLIPQHHCNFNKEKRPHREVKVVGFCGEHDTFAPFENEIREKLKKIGLELYFKYTYKNRNGVVGFYKDIDIQIIWRVSPGYIEQLKNPLKLSNAGSFDVPTVAIPEPNFVAEYDGCFLPCNTIDEMIGLCEDLKNDSVLYYKMADKAAARAENYHFSNIAKLYRKLAE